MATETHFDLNTAFENWRNELAAQPQLSPDDRRELEKHLSDSMADLRQRGLNEEEAFWLARRRMGQPQELAKEFKKVKPLKVWRERALWMVASILAFQIWMGITFPLRNLLIGYLGFNLQVYRLFPLPYIVVCYLPFVLAIVLIATGRMAWLVRKSAMIVARRRIGQPQQLAEQFKKVELLKVWRERAFWMVASVLAFQIWMELSILLLNLLSYFHAYHLFPLPLVVCYCPIILVVVLFATGRLAWLVRKSAIIIHSQGRLALMTLLLVALFSFVVAYFRVAMFPRLRESLFFVTTRNMIIPLIFVPLLCVFMPRKSKILKGS